jgi:antitoxin HigA-1
VGGPAAAPFGLDPGKREIFDLNDEDYRLPLKESLTMRMARPAHPGEFIGMEVIEPPGLSVTKASLVLGVTRPGLWALLNRRAALSPDMALRIEKAFGPKLDTLLRMQTAYAIAAARDREGAIKVKRYGAKGRPAPETRAR